MWNDEPIRLVPAGSPRFRAELAFRDYLRSHEHAAVEYAALKRHLVARHRERYTAGRASFVDEILRRSAKGAGRLSAPRS